MRTTKATLLTQIRHLRNLIKIKKVELMDSKKSITKEAKKKIEASILEGLKKVFKPEDLELVDLDFVGLDDIAEGLILEIAMEIVETKKKLEEEKKEAEAWGNCMEKSKEAKENEHK